MPDEPSLGERFEHWLAERETAQSEGTLLRPMVPMTVTFDGWIASLAGKNPPRRFGPVRTHANALYQRAIGDVIENACELDKTAVLPSRYILAVTELIGQDQVNDVSHIFLVEQRPGCEPRMSPLVRNARIFHLHAAALGASYAVKHGVSTLRWAKDMTYAWS
jgi:hypothetical protein